MYIKGIFPRAGEGELLMTWSGEAKEKLLLVSVYFFWKSDGGATSFPGFSPTRPTERENPGNEVDGGRGGGGG